MSVKVDLNKEEKTKSKLEEWAEYFKIVGSPLRLMIILALYSSEILKRESHSLTFSEIKLISGVSSEETLAYHLRQLESVNFIRKDPYKDESNGRVYPLYHISDKGSRFLTDLGLVDILQEYLRKILTP